MGIIWSKKMALLFSVLLSPIVALAWEGGGLSATQAQGTGWSEPVNISNTPNTSWFPDLAVDGQGNVHVVWCETTHVEGRGESEQILYTRWDGHEWLEPNDLAAPQFFIYRNAIAIGPAGDFFMVFRKAMTGGYGIVFATAPALDAWSAAAWSSPRLVSARLHNYMADLAVDSRGTLHMVFDDMGEETDEVCLGGCADIYYRYSKDNGQTWSAPVNLSQSPVGSSREQLEIDDSDTIHVTWDEGWDRLTGVGVPLYSVYRSSVDGGLSWSNPVTITYPMTSTAQLTTTTPTSGTAQLTVGADGRGGVTLVWRNTAYWEIFYQWSTDYGETWSKPAAIPGVLARHWSTPFDLYDMATDSAGRIHLLVVGSQSSGWNAPLELYHVVWDGNAWSYPARVYSGPGRPEYPRLVISAGNHLHAVWGVRSDVEGALAHYEVWYSDGYSAAPPQTPPPSPTPTATLTPSPTATPAPTSTPYPTASSGTEGLPEGLYTENDEVLRLMIALTPVLFVVLLIAALRKARRRRNM